MFKQPINDFEVMNIASEKGDIKRNMKEFSSKSIKLQGC